MVLLKPLVLLVCVLGPCVCPPAKLGAGTGTGTGSKEGDAEPEHLNKVEKEAIEHVDKELDDLGLEYGRYLQQVVSVLEEDKEFAKKLENVSIEHIKSGAIAHELNFVDHNVRSKLDELKRLEMDRLRKLTKKEHDLKEASSHHAAGQGGGEEGEKQRRWRSISKRLELGPDSAGHVDHENPHTFEVEDLHKLILKATHDLEELDTRRKEEFKRYEMEKELTFQESLGNLTEVEKEAARRQHEQLVQKHNEHPRVHEPGSRKQLEQVWEEQDHMPKEEFNPKTFFAMHDVNGDGVLDQEEVEALLSLEVRKMYDPEHNSEDDANEMAEEFHRMREHIYAEADRDKDGLISRKEFLDMTARADFAQDEGWKGIEEQPQYTPEELRHFQEQQHRQVLAMQQQQHHPGQPQQHHYQVPQQYGHVPGQQHQYALHPEQIEQLIRQQQQQQQMHYQQQQQGQQYPPQQGQYGPGHQQVPPPQQQHHQGQLPPQYQQHPGQGQQYPAGGGHPPQYAPPQQQQPQYGSQQQQQHQQQQAPPQQYQQQQQHQQQQFIGQMPPVGNAVQHAPAVAMAPPSGQQQQQQPGQQHQFNNNNIPPSSQQHH